MSLQARTKLAAVKRGPGDHGRERTGTPTYARPGSAAPRLLSGRLLYGRKRLSEISGRSNARKRPSAPECKLTATDRSLDEWIEKDVSGQRLDLSNRAGGRIPLCWPPGLPQRLSFTGRRQAANPRTRPATRLMNCLTCDELTFCRAAPRARLRYLSDNVRRFMTPRELTDR